jgi:hypothetical protein
VACLSPQRWFWHLLSFSVPTLAMGYTSTQHSPSIYLLTSHLISPALSLASLTTLYASIHMLFPLFLSPSLPPPCHCHLQWLGRFSFSVASRGLAVQGGAP